MALSRKTKLLLLGLAVLVALVLLGGELSREHVGHYLAGVHQRSVTKTIAEWGNEYAAVTNGASAIASAEMVGYMSHYYVPGPGYRGPAEVEAALEKQRAESIRRVTDALQRYTGLDYGTNAQRWTEWAELRKKEMARTRNSEPDGPANRSQPVRQETNQASPAAGSGR
jgi:hypothetical protein